VTTRLDAAVNTAFAGTLPRFVDRQGIGGKRRVRIEES